jgi:Zn-dependent protease/CBS domain-containing protein
MKSSIKLGRIFGIQISVHFSWLFILVLIMLSLSSYFSATQSNWSQAMRWGASLLTALLFFASVVAHELAHSLVAKRFGIEVRSITLFIFGGVSEIESEAKRPSEEFWIAIVGPLTSVAVAAISSSVLIFASMNSFIGAIAGWLSAVNLGLAIFNMLPGFPLDGGRILRSLIWWKTSSSRKATQIAAGVGQILALVMILAGIWVFFRPEGDFGGLWIAFIGWFLLDAARSSTNQLEIEDTLRGVTAADLMTNYSPSVSPDLTLNQFVDDYLLRTGQRRFLVEGLVEGNEMVFGIISAKDLKGIDHSKWPYMKVADAMIPFDHILTVSPNTAGNKILEIMGREGVNQLAVVAGGRLQGLVSREQIINLLTTRMELAPGIRGILNPYPARSGKGIDREQRRSIDRAA